MNKSYANSDVLNFYKGLPFNYYEDLDKDSTEKIIEQILDGQDPKPGSYRGRKNSEPENNRKTLIDLNNA